MVFLQNIAKSRFLFTTPEWKTVLYVSKFYLKNKFHKNMCSLSTKHKEYKIRKKKIIKNSSR